MIYLASKVVNLQSENLKKDSSQLEKDLRISNAWNLLIPLLFKAMIIGGQDVMINFNTASRELYEILS